MPRPGIHQRDFLMIFRNRAPLAAAVAALLALSACESATEPGLAPQGSVSFTYAGDHAGSYSASGRYDRQRPGLTSFAVGSRAVLTGGAEALLVLSHVIRPNDPLLADEFLLSVENPEVGTRTCTEDQEDCSFSGLLFLGANRAGATEDIYASVSGTITITSINEDRARGTFSFQMQGVNPEDEVQTTQITNGTFDVPLVAGVS